MANWSAWQQVVAVRVVQAMIIGLVENSMVAVAAAKLTLLEILLA
jgi:hypothetical protein